MASSNSTTISDYQGGNNPPSPLLATVIEQISSKFVGSLCPSDTLAIVSFVRRLLVRLSGKQGSLNLLICLSEKLDSLPVGEVFAEKHAIVGSAVAQEIKILKNYLLFLREPDTPTSPPGSPASAVTDFLDRIENIPIRTTLRYSLRFCFAHCRLKLRQMRCVRIRPLNLLTVYASSTLRSRRIQRCG